MSNRFSFSCSDPASVRRCLAQVSAIADVLDQLSTSISAAVATAPVSARMRLTTAAGVLKLAADECRDAAQQLVALLP